MKSHRAKGKRLTTYEVDTLRMIEPELPTEPEPSEDEEFDGDMSSDASEDNVQAAVAAESAPAKEAPKESKESKESKEASSGGIVSDAGLPRTGSEAGGVAFEIERPKGDAEQMIDPEQLNLF